MKVYKVNVTEEELKLFSEFLEQKVFENQKDNDILNNWIPDYTGDLKQPWLSNGAEGVKKSREDYNKYQDKYKKSIDKSIQIAKKEGLYKDSSNKEFEHIFNGWHQPSEALVDFSPKSDAASRDEAAADIVREYQIYRSNTGHYHPLNRTDEVINTDRFIYYNSDGRKYDRNLTDFAEEVKSKLPLSPKGKERLVKEVLNPVKKYDPKTDQPLEEIKDVPIITEPEEEDNNTLALAHQVRFNEEQKKKIGDAKPSGRTYNPKTDQPLEEIKDVPIITGTEEKERTKELNKFRRDRKREEFVNRVKEIPGKVKNKFDSLSKNYEDISDGRSLGKDAAIIAGTTAALGAGAYGIHRYLKNKKKNKNEAEKKYKTSDKKKK